MSRLYVFTIVLLVMFIMGADISALAQTQEKMRYELTITNLTRGQYLTSPFIVLHKSGIRLFTLGEPVSPQFASLVEDVNPNALGSVLAGLPEVKQVVTAALPPAEALIAPGKSATVTVDMSLDFNQISFISSLVPTNDAFIALHGVTVPKGDATLSFFIPAYDAGSERNDELCASLFAPSIAECGGAGGGGHPGEGEGFVYIHNGIHGVGNLNAALRDWRNPVARVLLRRVGAKGQAAAGVDL
jgi:hypothetical protein